MTVRQEDPRPSQQHVRNIDWASVVSQVKALEGKFGNIGVFSPGIAQHLRKGLQKQFLPAGFEGDPKAYMTAHYEITSRSISQRPQRVEIFVRWKG